MANAVVCQMPMELRLELMAAVSADGMNPERELLDPERSAQRIFKTADQILKAGTSRGGC